MASEEVLPQPGERCTCGRPAVIVYVTPEWGRVPFCGQPDDIELEFTMDIEP